MDMDIKIIEDVENRQLFAIEAFISLSHVECRMDFAPVLFLSLSLSCLFVIESSWSEMEIPINR